MKITVCNIDSVLHEIKNDGITHVLSLIRNENLPDLKLGKFDRTNWLHLNMEDEIDLGVPGGPTSDHVHTIIEFGRNLPEDAHLLVHCIAGVSRSPAAALVIKVARGGTVEEAIKWLKTEVPFACPNPVITQLADFILECDGKLFEQSEEIANTKLLKFGGSMGEW